MLGEALEIAPVEELDLDVGIALTEFSQLPVLAGDEGILLQQGEGASLEIALVRAHADGKALETLADRVARLLPRRAPVA